MRGVYTWSKVLDDGDSLNETTAGNAPDSVSTLLISADRGLATYDVRNIGVVNALYECRSAGAEFAREFEGWATAW